MSTDQPKKPLSPFGFLGYYLLFLVVIGTPINGLTNSSLGTAIGGISAFVIVFMMDRNRRRLFKDWQRRQGGPKDV
jgi:hypothetical protein